MVQLKEIFNSFFFFHLIIAIKTAIDWKLPMYIVLQIFLLLHINLQLYLRIYFKCAAQLKLKNPMDDSPYFEKCKLAARYSLL